MGTILLHFTNAGRSTDLTADSVNLQLNILESKRMKCFPWKSQSTLLNVAMSPFPTPRDCIVYLCLIPPILNVCLLHISNSSIVFLSLCAWFPLEVYYQLHKYKPSEKE